MIMMKNSNARDHIKNQKRHLLALQMCQSTDLKKK